MPRRDFLLDDSGNRVLVGNEYGFADGQQAVKQGIACRVRLYEGEVWYNQALGVAYLTRILIHDPNPLVVQAEIARPIGATPDVTQVVNTSYSVDGRTRKATVGYTATTTEGTIEGTVTT